MQNPVQSERSVYSKMNHLELTRKELAFGIASQYPFNENQVPPTKLSRPPDPRLRNLSRSTVKLCVMILREISINRFTTSELAIFTVGIEDIIGPGKLTPSVRLFAQATSLLYSPVMPHGPEQLLLELFAIFVAAKVVGELFERIRLPAVLGEILAGVGFGPFALGWIHPSDTIHSVAEIGAIFVLFHTGLETSPHELIRVGRKALLVAANGIVAPFVLGFVYMRWRGDASTEAVFVGAAMVATSVGITARVLGDLGIHPTRSAKIILGAAVFDDILGMVLLAVVACLASPQGLEWIHLVVLIAEAAAFALFMIFVAPRIVRRLEPRMGQLFTHNASFIVALALCLFLSWLSAKIGMAAIIGAFFAGMMFADYAPRWNLLPRVSSITEFLAPYFFFAIGARLNIRLFTREVLVAAVVISVLAILSKVAACGLPLLREGWQKALQVGVGMMPRSMRNSSSTLTTSL